MAAPETADVHLFHRLSQMETDLDGMCRELHRRRSPLKSQETESKVLTPQSKDFRSKSSPNKPGLSISSSRGTKNSSRGDLRKSPKSASATNLQPQEQRLSAVLETPTATARRIGASREDPSSSVCTAKSNGDPPRILTKGKSVSALGSSSSGSCAGLATVASSTSLATPWTSEAVSDGGSDRSPKPVGNGLTPRRGRLLGPLSKSVAVPCAGERINLGDSSPSRASTREAEAKRDLVWQLELERLRNATLKLEVQREMCESSDLRKRLRETEPGSILAPSQAVLMPTVPAVPSVTTVSSVTRLHSASLHSTSLTQLPPSVAGSVTVPFDCDGARPASGAGQARRVVSSLSVQQHAGAGSDGARGVTCVEAAAVQQSAVPLTSQRPLHFSPRHRGVCAPGHAPISPRLQ